MAYPVCKVCGSSAPVTIANAIHGTRDLCYAHECVCWPHMADPCPICDGGE